MLFFESLLPHIENFNDSEMLQLKMGVLQVISSIASKQTAVPHNQGFPNQFVYQPPPYHSQSFNFPTHSQQHFITPHTPASFNRQHHAVSSYPNPLANQTTTFTVTPAQVQNVVAISTPVPAQQTKKSPALSPTLDEDNRSEAVRRYVEDQLFPHEDSNGGSSSLCSNASSPFDFCSL